MADEYPELAASQIDAKKHLHVCPGGDLSTFGETFETFRVLAGIASSGGAPLRTIQAM